MILHEYCYKGLRGFKSGKVRKNLLIREINHTKEDKRREKREKVDEGTGELKDEVVRMADGR